jgi:hypothetical protein
MRVSLGRPNERLVHYDAKGRFRAIIGEAIALPKVRSADDNHGYFRRIKWLEASGRLPEVRAHGKQRRRV